MLSDDVRARLARLVPRAASSAPPRRSLRRPSPAAPVADAPAGPGFRLSEAETCRNTSGEHLRFRRSVADFWPAAEDVVGRASARQANDTLPASHPELTALAAHFPARALFLDLETCGFAGSPIFLVGVVWRREETLVIDQLFARHYAEERAVLETLWQAVVPSRVLVTFNGKSFDWPMVRDRTVRHRFPGGRHHAAGASGEPTHCDLLHHCRRRYKKFLPDCRLQTLERYLCRRVRHNDLPGALVPAAYHYFVRTGNARRLARSCTTTRWTWSRSCNWP